MDYNKVIPQNKQYKQLLSENANGKLSHAYLLKNADSFLLENFCYSLSANLVSCKPERVSKNIHPDVIVLGQNSKIDASSVAELVSNLNVKPYEADKKIYILLNAENINETSQNKILKSLEEPPKNVIFLLTCASTKKLLPTVLSRVKLIEVDNLTNSQILEMLVAEGKDKQMAEVAVSNCQGNSTLAHKLTTNSFLGLYNNCLALLKNVNSSRDCLEYISLLDDKSVDKNELLDVIIGLVRDISIILCGNTNLVINKQSLSELTEISKGFTFVATSNIITECLHLKEDLFYNTNNTAVVDSLVLLIAQEKFKCKK